MSQAEMAHNYAGQMEALSLAIGQLATDIGSVIAPMDTAATTLGTQSTQATTAKGTVTEAIGTIRTAAGHMENAGEKLESNTIISPNHSTMRAAEGAGIEALHALDTAVEQYTAAEATLETQSTKLGERQTLIAADSTALKEFVQQCEAFGTEVTAAADVARPAW